MGDQLAAAENPVPLPSYTIRFQCSKPIFPWSEQHHDTRCSTRLNKFNYTQICNTQQDRKLLCSCTVHSATRPCATEDSQWGREEQNEIYRTARLHEVTVQKQEMESTPVLVRHITVSPRLPQNKPR